MKYKIFHNTAVSQIDQSIQLYAVNRYHQQEFNILSSLGWYVAYNWFIDVDGTATQCRKDGEEGCHTIGYNKEIAICFAGNGDKELPNDKQILALRKLDKQYSDLKWELHRNLQLNRTCPGKLITLEILNELLIPKEFSPKTIEEKKADSIIAATSTVDSLLKTISELRQVVAQLISFISNYLKNGL